MAPSLNDDNNNRPTDVSSELCFEVLIRSKRKVIEENGVVCILIPGTPPHHHVPGFVAGGVALERSVSNIHNELNVKLLQLLSLTISI